MRGMLKPAFGGLGALVTFTALSGTAWAGTDAAVDVYCPQPFCNVEYAGTGYFDEYGDRIKACDMNDDGLGVEVKLDIGRDGDYERVVDTRGHASVYCSPWRTGNIAEGTRVTIRVCLVNGDFETSCGEDDGVA